MIHRATGLFLSHFALTCCNTAVEFPRALCSPLALKQALWDMLALRLCPCLAPETTLKARSLQTFQSAWVFVCVIPTKWVSVEDLRVSQRKGLDDSTECQAKITTGPSVSTKDIQKHESFYKDSWGLSAVFNLNPFGAFAGASPSRLSKGLRITSPEG